MNKHNKKDYDSIHSDDDDYENEEDDSVDDSIEAGNQLIIGIDYPQYSHLPHLLEIASRNETNFVCVPLFHPRYRRSLLANTRNHVRVGTVTRSDVILERNDWIRNIIGLASTWIQFHDYEKKEKVEENRLGLMEEYGYACHLGLQAMIIPMIAQKALLSHSQLMKIACCYGKSIVSALIGSHDSDDEIGSPRQSSKSYLRSVGSTRMWVTIPYQYYSIHANSSSSSSSPSSLVTVSGWDVWNAIRQAADNHPLLHVVLDLTAITGNSVASINTIAPVAAKEKKVVASGASAGRTKRISAGASIEAKSESFVLPPKQEIMLDIWLGEPVEAIIVHTRQFQWEIHVDSGEPTLVLPNYLQTILRPLMGRNVQVILRGLASQPPQPKDPDQVISARIKSKAAKGTASNKRTSASQVDAVPQFQLKEYLEAIELFWDKCNDTPSTLYDQFCSGYRDSLRAPLQPLADHLDSETYTVMEQDPIKYQQYEAAIAVALVDQMAMKQDSGNSHQSSTNEPSLGNRTTGKRKGAVSSSTPGATNNTPKKQKSARQAVSARPNRSGWQPLPSRPIPESLEERSARLSTEYKAWNDDQFVRVVVVGPGRGPLIRATLNASESTSIPVIITAVEKNPNAVITLRNRAIAESWGDRVTIVQSDMRKWQPEHVSDIIVSELLGSWGDNECSPECLRDVLSRGCLRAVSGVSIPYRYTSYVAPVISHKNWNAARLLGLPSGLETPYVVELFNHFVLSKAKPVFSFTHFSQNSVHDNSTYKDSPEDHTEGKSSMNIHIDFSNCTVIPAGSKLSEERDAEFTDDSILATIHGFSGYFDCGLYKDVGFSTVPQTFSTGMFSWFPMYIPCVEPITVRVNCADIPRYNGSQRIFKEEKCSMSTVRSVEKPILGVDIWRHVSPEKMWYEWQVTGIPQDETGNKVHNLNGLCSSVRL